MPKTLGYTSSQRTRTGSLKNWWETTKRHRKCVQSRPWKEFRWSCEQQWKQFPTCSSWLPEANLLRWLTNTSRHKHQRTSRRTRAVPGMSLSRGASKPSRIGVSRPGLAIPHLKSFWVTIWTTFLCTMKTTKAQSHPLDSSLRPPEHQQTSVITRLLSSLWTLWATSLTRGILLKFVKKVARKRAVMASGL